MAAGVPLSKLQSQVASAVAGLEQTLLIYYAETWLSPAGVAAAYGELFAELSERVPPVESEPIA